MTLTVTVALIDEQNDFIGNEDGSPYSFSLGNGVNFNAALPVAGAFKQGFLVAEMLKRNIHKITTILATLDSHQLMDVAHQAWWMDENNNLLPPFTIVTNKGIQEGKFIPRVSTFKPRMLDYTQKLENQGNYPLMIWPNHCIIGTPGHNIFPPIMSAFDEWCVVNKATIDYVTKGSNPFTEHYGALQAEVTDPKDPSTQLNTSFIEALEKSDIVAIAGQASSHCVKTTVQQIVDNIGDKHLHKIHLLTDCMAPVAQPPGGPDFPQIAADFLINMQNRGLHLTKSTDFLK